MMKNIVVVGCGVLLLAACVSSPQTAGTVATKAVGVAAQQPLFTFAHRSYGIEIQPAVAGQLVWRDGCLMLDNGLMPVFPDDITQWDAATQTVRAGNIRIAVGEKLMANHLGIVQYDPVKPPRFVRQGQVRCLRAGMRLVFVGSQIRQP